MEDEELKQQEAAKAAAVAGKQIVYPLNSTSTTTHGDKQVVKKGGETLETSTTQKGFKLTPDMQAAMQSDMNDLANLYDVDAKTGRFKGTPGSLFGFDPQEYIKQQEKEARDARVRGKVKQWGNFAQTLLDIGTQHGGGTVWERKDDGQLSKLEEKENAAKDNVFKMQQAIPQAMAAREKQYQEAVSKLKEQYRKMGESTSTIKGTQKGDEVTTTIQGADVTKKQYDQLGAKNGGGKDNNGFGTGTANKPKIIKVRLKGQNGNPSESVNIIAPNYVVEAYAQNIVSYLKGRVAAGDANIQKVLDDNGVSIAKKDLSDPTGLATYEDWTWNKLVASGIVFEDDYCRKEILKMVDQYATPEVAARVRAQMQTYATSTPQEKEQKKDWLSSMWDKIFGDKESTNQSSASTDTWGDVSGAAGASEEYDDNMLFN